MQKESDGLHRLEVLKVKHYHVAQELLRLLWQRFLRVKLQIVKLKFIRLAVI